MASLQPPTFGQLLKHHRIAAGLTQEELAERAGLGARSISDMERGLRSAPYQNTIHKLARALRLSAAERARLEAAARRRRAPRMPRAPGAPASSSRLLLASPEAPTAGPPPPVAATPIPERGREPSMVVPAGTGSRPSSTGIRPPPPQPGEAFPPAVDRLRPSAPQLGARGAGVVRYWLPWLPRARDRQTLRRVSSLLVGILLVGALVSIGVARQHPGIGAGMLCLATEFPTAGDNPRYGGAWGRSLEHAVDLAVQQNQPLGNGYTLEVIHYREVSAETAERDPQQGAHNVTDMVQTPCIVGMVGPAWSSVAAAELPIAAKAGLVMISPANTRPGLTLRLYARDEGMDFDRLHPPGTKTTYFRDIANDAFQGLELADFTSRPPPEGLGARSAFLVYGHTPYGETLVGGFTQRFLAMGGAIVGTEGIPFGGAPRIGELAARIAAARPEAVVYGGYNGPGVPEGGLLKAQLVQVGYLGPFVGGDGIAKDPAFVAQVGATAANDVFAIDPVPDPTQIASGAAASFVRAFHARYPGEVLDGYGANAYDAAMVLLTAIKRLIQTGQQVTRQAVLDQVQTIQYAGVTGQISFDRNGESAHGIFSVYTVQDGRWVWVKQSSV